jgi:hypothetical protein
LRDLFSSLTASQVVDELHSQESLVSELEKISSRANDMNDLDMCIAEAWRKIHHTTQLLTSSITRCSI